MEGFALVRGCYLKQWKLGWICLTNTDEIILYKTREKLKLYRLYRVLRDSGIARHDDIGDKRNILHFSNLHGLPLLFSLQSAALEDIWFAAIQDSIHRQQGAIDNSLQSIRFAPYIVSDRSEGRHYLESYATKRGHFRGSWKVRLLRLEHGTITYFDSRQRLKGKIVLYPHTSVSRHPDIGPYRNLVHIFTAKEKGLIFSLESFDLKELWMTALVEQITAFKQQQEQEIDEPVTATTAPESSNRSLFVGSPKRIARSRADGRRLEVAETIGPATEDPTMEHHVVDAMDLPRISMLQNDMKDVHQVYDSIAFLESDEEDSVMDGEEGDSDAFPDAPPCPEEVDSFIRRTIISNIDQDCYRFEQESSVAIDEEPTEGEVEASTIAINSDAVESSTQLPESDWLEACTEDGKVYFYHRITRLTRWVKPDSHIEQASELRIREAEEVLERHILDRKLELQQLQLKTAAYERIREESMSDIMLRLKEWSTRMDKQGNVCPLQFPELLRDLMLILPTDLLLVVYTASNNVTVKTVLHDVRTFTISTDPREVKKAYMKAMRFLHPDKLPSDIDITSKLLVEQLFILLTEKYDAFRKAHDV